MRKYLTNQAGFTLMEMIIVIVITGIIGGMVAMFIRAPVQAYADSARRAGLTDEADTALRRIGRDVRTAVPNSARVSSCVTAGQCIEFLPSKDGGMYAALSGNILNFGAGGSNTFDILGSTINFSAAPADYIVVGSTQSNAVPAYDVSVNGVLRQYTGLSGAQTIVTFTNTVLPTWAELSSQRFDVVDGTQQAVTYACVASAAGACTTDASGNGTCQLMRYWKYGFNTSGTGGYTAGTSAVLANNVSSCQISYGVISQRFGLLTMLLKITNSNESVSLYDELHVNNAP
jgi:MSHA biogenesis protein MshO